MKAEGTAPSGILLVDKPSGITSHDVIYAVRRAFGTKQAGHTGTLDPLATGLLAVMVGRAVKASPYLTAGRKEYSAGIRFGVETDTEDITGNVISEKDVSFTAEEVKTACDALTGQIEQIPPMYSAKKVGGKKLYELARLYIQGFLLVGDLYQNSLRRHGKDARLRGSHDFSAEAVCRIIIVRWGGRARRTEKHEPRRSRGAPYSC